MSIHRINIICWLKQKIDASVRFHHHLRNIKMKINMSIKVVALAFAGLLAFYANAEDDRPAAPEAVVAEAKQLCEDDAKESGVEQDDMRDYVLACVNEELESQGYQAVVSL